jgi:hypothetical protein
LLTHLLGHVAVNVQREAGGGVAEIALDGLDIVAAFNGDDGVAVAQIVKARLLQADPAHNVLEAVVDCKMAEVLTKLIREYQIPGIAPRKVGNLFFMRLLLQRICR